MMTTEHRTPRLNGVLVTFRRPTELERILDALNRQTSPLARLVVVDNAPDPANADVVRRLVPNAEYVAAPENLGPAGGIALGMERILESATDGEWIVTLDDDDPPSEPTRFADLLSFAAEVSGHDSAVGAVGVTGMRFDRARGRIVRVPDHELRGAVPVDAIAGNQFPCYSVSALRRVGSFRRDLFFGFEELEFGLRLREAGLSLYAHGPSWYTARRAAGRLGRSFPPSRSLGPISWRRYYSLRNMVRILCDRRAFGAAIRVSVVTGLGKPLANVLREPALALRHLALNARAMRDGWTRRMGRTVEPLA